MNINENSKSYRECVVEVIKLLSSPSEQMKYERDVPIADVPSELICEFADDLYHPKSELFLNAFTEEELRSLAELYGRICIASNTFKEMDCNSVADIQKVPEWRNVMEFSKNLMVELKQNS